MDLMPCVDWRRVRIMFCTKMDGKITIMSGDQIINLGEISPHQQVSAYFELDLSEPARVIYADNCSRWIRVFSSAPNKEGKQMFQLICDTGALDPGAIAVGNIEVVTASLKKNYWIMVKVLHQSLADEVYDIYLEDKDGHRIYFENGFLIGNKQLPGCGHEKQAILLKENGGTWAVFVPWKTPINTTLNGVDLSFGQRALLTEGISISAGNIDLTVQRKKKPGGYSASQSMLDFGVLGAALAQQKIQVTSSKYSKATITSTVPWLIVSLSTFDCQPGVSVDVVINVKTEDVNLGPGRYRERSAILVHDQDETLSLDVNFEITAQTIIPKISSPLNFGVVSEHWNAATATTMIINDGLEKWIAKAVADQNWLTIDNPDFDILPGKNMQLTVRLNEHVRKLPRPGNYTADITLAGGGVKLSIPVGLRLNDPSVHLDIAPLNMDLGDIISWDSLPSGILHVTNMQSFSVMVRIESGLDWVAVEPRRAFCEPGQTLQFVVKLNEDKGFVGLRVRKYSVSAAIKLFAGREEFLVGLELDIKKSAEQYKKSELSTLPLAFDVAPVFVDLGSITDWDGPLPRKEIALMHNQKNPVPVVLESTVPWLGVRPESISCPPEGCIVTVEMLGKNYSQGLRARQYNVSDAIVVKGDNIAKKIPVKVDISGMARSDL